MARFHGVEVYEVIENGNILNAIYSNTSSLDIQNETAKKKYPLNAGIIGIYTTRFTENGSGTVIDCELEIKKTGEVYEFNWMKNGLIIWEGIGLMAGINHIAVSYINP